MKKRLLIAAGLTSVLAMSVGADGLRSDYITWPSSARLHNYVNAWEKGEALTKTWNDAGSQSEWEDEEFFTSRVKLKPYFRNAATQVYDIAEDKDKNLLFWVPIGYDNLAGLKTNALPNAKFDSEVFSMWPYVTHFGNWTSPHGWVPAGFADAAHKHGTAVSGVASIPNAPLSGNWSTCMKEMGDMSKSDAGVAKLGDFLAYHGVDGLGYNSEYSTSTTIQNNINTLHNKLVKYMRETKGNTRFENPWYAAVTDGAGIDFTSALTSNNRAAFGDASNPRTIYFINYSWLGSLSTTSNNLAITGRDARDLYMGMNMQAGCKSSGEWMSHANQNYSIGLWGAHDFNYIWNRRSAEGSSDVAKQSTYQKHIEQWFTNGNRNPANRIAPFYTTSLAPSDDWMGMSAYMTARSTLGWDLSDEPFMTFFNIGNGRFFNWKGERMNDNEWYNLGVQDYTPTWRFWWASELLGNTADKVPANGLTAEYSWNDAYMGGSSLRIHGSTNDEYLHLFKTKFKLSSNDVITIRYKLVDGQTDLNLILTEEGKETDAIRESSLSIIKTTAVADDEKWVEVTFKVVGTLGTPLRNKTIALVGLHFKNAQNLDMYLGEFSICKSGSTATPQAPVITKSKLMSCNYKGADGKLIYKMANNKTAGEPVYNTDVNTSWFKIWSKSGNEEPTLLGVTTSWGAIAYCAPVANGATSVQLGVQAVSLDFKNESAITWSENLTLPSYETIDEVVVDKSTITPNEPFKISFVDTNHPVASWSLADQSGKVVASATGVTILDVPDGLPEVGGYNLTVDGTTYEYLVQISDPKAGKLPEIQTLTIDGNDVTEASEAVKINVNEEHEFGYTGRESDGACSRAIDLQGRLVGVNAGDLGIGSYKSFSVAAWVKMTSMPAGISNLLTIETRAGSWPKNTWGFFWSRVAGDGTMCYDKIDGCWGGSLDSGADGWRLYSDYKGVKFSLRAWYHLVWVFEYNSSNQLSTAFYVNGVKQNIDTWARILKSTREGKGNWADIQSSINAGATVSNSGKNSDQTGFVATSYPLASTNWISFGGGSTAADINAVEGAIDDFQIWGKAMTQEDVNKSMAGLDGNNLPSDVIAFWDFESDPNSSHYFLAKGSKAGAKACWFEYVSGAGEGEASVVPSTPLYTAGPASLPGDAFKVETLPTWTARKGTLSESAGNHTAGSTKLSYATGREGDSKVSLNLANTYGEHTMMYPVISVGTTAAIDGVGADGQDFNVTVEGSMLILDIVEDGSYSIDVYNTAGLRVNAKKTDILAGQNVTISLANAGVYLVRVAKDGKLLRTVKVIRK